jgi:hypothetical protein
MSRTRKKSGGYSSKYYDPDKAHAYYMANRKLKGRTSTKGMSQKQKEALKYIKEQLKEEKKKVIADTKKVLDGQIKTLRQTIKDEIARMREAKNAALKGTKDKAEKQRIRDEYNAKSKALREQMKGQISKARSAYKDFKTKLKDYYKEKYNQEYDNVKAKM